MEMDRWVDIQFDCLPLRSVARWDPPLDASPRLHDFYSRLKQAHLQHGAHNTYYLHNAHCIYRLTNAADVGMLEFEFEGVVITEADDRLTVGSDLRVALVRETCDWLTEPVVAWFRESVQHAVRVEFDRYIQAGDLERTRQRIAQLESLSDQSDGFLGMYL
jgi:hypothetical protein